MVLKLVDLQLYNGEIIIDIPNGIIPGLYDYYKITNAGRVFNKYTNAYMKPGISGSKYLFYELATVFGPKMVQAHRLVMLSFFPIPNSELFDVNHKDGNKFNNWYWNLEWCTRQENIIHAYKNGLNYVCEDNPKSTISNDTAIKICELLQSGDYTNQEIANICGTTISIVAGIKKNKWNHISKNYNFSYRKYRLFNEDIINDLCKYFASHSKGNLTVNDHCRNALNYYGYEITENLVDSARKVYTRKYYTNISSKYVFLE